MKDWAETLMTFAVMGTFQGFSIAFGLGVVIVFEKWLYERRGK